jgi:hypothetical protein
VPVSISYLFILTFCYAQKHYEYEHSLFTQALVEESSRKTDQEEAIVPVSIVAIWIATGPEESGSTRLAAHISNGCEWIHWVARGARAIEAGRVRGDCD